MILSASTTSPLGVLRGGGALAPLLSGITCVIRRAPRDEEKKRRGVVNRDHNNTLSLFKVRPIILLLLDNNTTERGTN